MGFDACGAHPSVVSRGDEARSCLGRSPKMEFKSTCVKGIKVYNS